jgi:branched-chain amino acid aminotransferase
MIDLCSKIGVPCIEKTLQRHDLYVADECLLTGTAAEVIAVTKIDGRVIGDGKPGPITQKLLEGFRRLIREA